LLLSHSNGYGRPLADLWFAAAVSIGTGKAAQSGVNDSA